MDSNGDGVLSKLELITGFNKMLKNQEVAEQIVDKIMHELGMTDEDNIDYTCFYIQFINL